MRWDSCGEARVARAPSPAWSSGITQAPPCRKGKTATRTGHPLLLIPLDDPPWSPRRTSSIHSPFQIRQIGLDQALKPGGLGRQFLRGYGVVNNVSLARFRQREALAVENSGDPVIDRRRNILASGGQRNVTSECTKDFIVLFLDRVGGWSQFLLGRRHL